MPEHTSAKTPEAFPIKNSMKKKRPVISALLSEEGFSVTYPEQEPRNKRSNTDKLAGLRPGMPSLMQIVEITDKDDKPLMCMPPDAVIRQKLHRRVVCVALRTKKNTVYLYKRAEPMLDAQGLWDLYSGAVSIGEAREDAALRLLQIKTGLTNIPLYYAASRAGSREHPAHLALFIAQLATNTFSAAEPHALMQVDADELAGLAAHTPELLTPALLWATSTGSLFRP